ncbi:MULTISPECIES: class I tRNA ligase family protein [Saccharothrix]|uniref:class I tRNA ligase family protein n=1 Tax=Saccharothrix TaxID=2071 RepID=UPI00093AC3A6|nr:class I tRNA ligase family protein [Saccharothrix sp. CB00851]OKI15521.1 hypothetical protein A6A25_14630 [Saccharothrix sp. CB00851]
MSHYYVTTTIPYVNARPHLGHALEFVQADVLARHHRQHGDRVRFLTGTDDNSLKNVLAARAEGLSTDELVDRNAAAFAGLREPLALSFTDFLRTSRDTRHRAGVERLWRACAHDFYRKHYEGLYCVGCEQFYTPAELVGGRCPEHDVEPQQVSEENWFFRLSRYTDRLRDLITDGTVRIEPGRWCGRAGTRRTWCTPPSPTSTSGGRRRRCGGSWRRPTATWNGCARGTWPAPNAAVTSRRAGGSTRPSPPC